MVKVRVTIQGWSGNEGDPWEDLGAPVTVRDWDGLESRYVLRQGKNGPLVVDVTDVEGPFRFHYHGHEPGKEWEGHSHNLGDVAHGHPAYSDWRLDWLASPQAVPKDPDARKDMDRWYEGLEATKEEFSDPPKECGYDWCKLAVPHTHALANKDVITMPPEERNIPMRMKGEDGRWGTQMLTRSEWDAVVADNEPEDDGDKEQFSDRSGVMPEDVTYTTVQTNFELPQGMSTEEAEAYFRAKMAEAFAADVERVDLQPPNDDGAMHTGNAGWVDE